MLKWLVSHGRELKDTPIEALTMCHAGQDEMILMQHIAEEIIRQSDDAEFHTIFDLSYTDSSTIDIQGTMYLKALMIKLFELNSTSRLTQHQRVEEAIWSCGKRGEVAPW